MLIRTRFSIALAGFALLTAFALAQEPVKPSLTPRIITATKQVTMFSGLENQMVQALKKKDKAAVEAMLTDEFTVHFPSADPLAGDEWLDSVMSKDFVLKSCVLRQFWVADLGASAVVSYDRLQESTSKGKDDGGEFFVVDLWKKVGDSWKLSDRYVSKVSSTIPKTPVKPTGKQ